MRNKSMRPGKSTDPHQVQLMILYEKINDIDLGRTGPHQVCFRGPSVLFPPGAGGNPPFSSKNTSGLQKMRAVLLIIFEVERTRLDKI